MTDKVRKSWERDYMEALSQAAGIAYILGYKDAAAVLLRLSVEAAEMTGKKKAQKRIDNAAKKRYTESKSGQTARNEEEKTMKNKFTLFDGCTITIISLGRDDGAEIIGRDTAGKIVCYIATENTTQDRAEITQAIKDGAQTLEQVFDMWENGLGGSPFDMEYLPEYYK